MTEEDWLTPDSAETERARQREKNKSSRRLGRWWGREIVQGAP